MNKLVYAGLLILLGLSACLGYLSLTTGHPWGDDFAGYILQAQSIVRGDEQDFVNHNAFTITKSSFLIGPVAYPWGYPLILAPIYAISGLNLILLKLPNLFFFIAFLACLFFLFKRRLLFREALLLTATIAFHPTFLGFLDQILSDIPYLFFSFVVLLFIDEIFFKEDTGPADILKTLLLGVLFYAVFFIRNLGLILLITFLMLQAIRIVMNGWKNPDIGLIFRRVIVACLTFGALWLLTRRIFPGGQGSYITEYSFFSLDTLRENSIYYFWLFGQFFEPLTYWRVIYFLSLVFFVIGVWTRCRRDQGFLVYFVISILVLISYPGLNGIRYIFPLLPLYAYFSYQGMKKAAISLKTEYRSAALALTYGFWLLTIAVSLVASMKNGFANWPARGISPGPFDNYSLSTYQFIVNNTSTDSVIVFFKPRIMRLMTDRNTLAVDNCKQLKMGDYDVIDKPIGADGQVPSEVVLLCPIQLKQVFENPEFIVYQILKKK